MARAADLQGIGGEYCAGGVLQLHSDEAQPHHRHHPLPQCFRRPPRVLLHQDMDFSAGQIWPPPAAIHPAGEHCHTDLCGCMLWHWF